MNCSTPGLPVHHQLPEFTQTHIHRVGDAIQPCHALLLLPSIPPSIVVFSNESTLLMRWPKYWSFSVSISPSSEHPGLISFRIDLPQEIRKWTNKHKTSRKKKKRNMKAESNGNENRETIEKISKTKSWFFEHFNRIDRLLLRLTEIKRKKIKLPTSRMK